MGIVEGAVVGGGIGIITGGATGYGVARAIERTVIAEIGPLPRPQIQAVRGACAIVGAASGVVTGGTVGALDAMQYRK